MPDHRTLAAATAAVRQAMEAEGYPSLHAASIALAAVSSIPEAWAEELPLLAARLDTLDTHEARFRMAGDAMLTISRGEWEMRGRPSRINVAVLDAPENG